MSILHLFGVFFLSAPQTTFHRIYNKKQNKNNKLDTSWISCYQLVAHLIMLHPSPSCVNVANPKGTKIYIYIYFHIVFTATVCTHFRITKQLGRKWRRFYKKQSFKKGGGDFSCTQWAFFFKYSTLLNFQFPFTGPWKILLNTQSFVKKERKWEQDAS